MKATRTLHELRRDKECLFACKSYDMKELIETAVTRHVSWMGHVFIRDCLLGGAAHIRILYITTKSAFGISPTCDIYKTTI